MNFASVTAALADEIRGVLERSLPPGSTVDVTTGGADIPALVQTARRDGVAVRVVFHGGPVRDHGGAGPQVRGEELWRVLVLGDTRTGDDLALLAAELILTGIGAEDMASWGATSLKLVDVGSAGSTTCYMIEVRGAITAATITPAPDTDSRFRTAFVEWRGFAGTTDETDVDQD